MDDREPGSKKLGFLGWVERITRDTPIAALILPPPIVSTICTLSGNPLRWPLLAGAEFAALVLFIVYAWTAGKKNVSRPWRWSAVVFAILALAWVVATLTPRTPCVLKSLRFYVRYDGNDKNTVYWDHLDHTEHGVAEPQIKAGVDDIKLTGTFSVPVEWCVLWHDTNGRVVLDGKSKNASKEVEYPDKEKKFVTADRADPPGTHFLLLLATRHADSVTADFIKSDLSQHPLGKPPKLQEPFVSEPIRGPEAPQGGVHPPPIATDIELREYVQKIRNWVPAKFEFVSAIGFNAEPGN